MSIHNDNSWFADHLRQWLGPDQTFSMVPAPGPYSAGNARTALSVDRPRAIAEFFRRCVNVGLAVLANELPPIVGQALFGDVPQSWSFDLLRREDVIARSMPQCFRTDESLDGKIFEIQPPGAGWGDYLLMCECYGVVEHARDAITSYANGLKEFCHRDDPRVLYLMDVTSSQIGARYFIQRTRKAGIRYYGWDLDIKSYDVDHIRSHAWQSLLTEPFARVRLDQIKDRPWLYDLPLNSMFGGKALLSLPYWRHTAEFFTQSERELFAYTTMVEPDGLQLAEGFVSKKDFLGRRPKDRKYYFKYGGIDSTKNWGGRGVYRADTGGRKTAEKLDATWADVESGLPWVAQESVARDPLAHSLISHDSGLLESDRTHSKLSVFCCYGRYFGTTLMLSESFKVHGAPDTILTIPRERPGLTSALREQPDVTSA